VSKLHLSVGLAPLDAGRSVKNWPRGIGHVATGSRRTMSHELLASPARASTCTPPATRNLCRPNAGCRPSLSRREGLLQRHLRRLPPRDGLLPDEQHQGRPVQHFKGTVRDPRRFDLLGHLPAPERLPEPAAPRGVTNYPEEITEKYTGIPATGLERTRELTEGATNPYGAMMAINRHLKETYPYDLFIPPQRQGMGAVECFLFEQRRGYCEQFSSSPAVMARSLGIPARVATGYVPSEYNSFTGLHEVRTSDAHAWVEVYFPGYGWSTFIAPPASIRRPGTTKRPATCRAAKPLAS
jgi:transglutaminase-like putative cysteine protease